MLDYQQHILQINQKINEIQKSRLQYLNLQHISVNDEISDTYVLGDINDAESQYDKLLKETTAKAIALNGLFIMVSYVDFLCSEYAKSFKKPDINSIYDALGQVNEENDIQTFWQDCMRIYYDANQDDQAINFNDRLSHIDDKALQSINKLRHCQGLYRHPKTMMMWQQSTDEVTTYLTIRQPQVALTKDQGLSLFKGVLHTLNPYEKILLFRKIKHMDGVPQMQLSSSEFAIFFDDDDAYQTTIFLALLQNILELPLPYDRIVQQWNQLKPDEQLLFKTKIRDILGCSTFESSAFGVDEIIDRLNQSKDVIDAIIDGLKNANLLNLDVNRFLSVVLYVEHDSPPPLAHKIIAIATTFTQKTFC